MECECGATIEAYIPSHMAGKHGIGCVKNAEVREDFWIGQYAECDEALEVNVCPFCGRTFSEEEVRIKMWEVVFRGDLPKIYWVYEGAICDYCGEDLDEEDIKGRMKGMKIKFDKNYHETLLAFLSLQIIKCKFCGEGKYFCAYCRRYHKLGSNIYFKHRVFAVKRKSAIREAGKIYRRVTKSDKPLSIGMRRDTFRAFCAILEKKATDWTLVVEEWGAKCSINGKLCFLFFQF